MSGSKLKRNDFYKCSSTNEIIFLLEMVWILTREQNPDLATLQKAYAVLDTNKITKAYLLRTDQFNCNTESESDTPTEDVI